MPYHSLEKPKQPDRRAVVPTQRPYVWGSVLLVNNLGLYAYRSASGLNYDKSVTLDYQKFTIKQFELHSPSASKELIIQAHGALRSPVHKVWNSSHVLNFYTPQETDLIARPNDFFRFQARKITVPPVEVIEVGEESRDYNLGYSDAFESGVSSFFHQSQALNPKPPIESLADLDALNFHDVLTIKPGKTVTLSEVLKQLPGYSKVHCFFCRSRHSGKREYAPFSEIQKRE